MQASVNQSSLIILAFLIEPKFAEQIKTFQKGVVSKFNLPEGAVPNPQPNIPFLGAKWIEPNKMPDLEKMVSEWAANQTKTTIIINRVFNMRDEAVYFEGYPVENPYSTSLTNVFYETFKEEEKDFREPYSKILIPVVKRMNGPKTDMKEIADLLLTNQFYEITNINAISILEYQNDNGWVERKKFEFTKV